jgi:hypothetical protein
VARHLEHAPGEKAAAAGTFEQLNIFGRPNGIRADIAHGQPMPQAPSGHNWRLVEEGRDRVRIPEQKAGPAKKTVAKSS